MSVPTSFFKGDTVTWTDTLAADYPATGWTLKYTFINECGKIEVTASADGDSYEATIDAATSDTYLPGDYNWVGKVTDIATGLEVHTVLAGNTKILVNVVDHPKYDARIWAEVALENVEAVIANRATLLQAEVAQAEDLISDGPSSKVAHVRF
jgi:hypothetical protein